MDFWGDDEKEESNLRNRKDAENEKTQVSFQSRENTSKSVKSDYYENDKPSTSKKEPEKKKKNYTFKDDGRDLTAMELCREYFKELKKRILEREEKITELLTRTFYEIQDKTEDIVTHLREEELDEIDLDEVDLRKFHTELGILQRDRSTKKKPDEYDLVRDLDTKLQTTLIQLEELELKLNKRALLQWQLNKESAPKPKELIKPKNQPKVKPPPKMYKLKTFVPPRTPTPTGDTPPPIETPRKEETFALESYKKSKKETKCNSYSKNT
jgi:hypothetical protein